MANCTYSYCVLTALGDTIFVWLCACPEWSLRRSIYVSGQVFMCLHLPPPSCRTPPGPNAACLLSIGDSLRSEGRIWRAGFGPRSQCRFGGNKPGLWLAQSSRSFPREAGPSSALSPLTAGHEAKHNARGFRSDSKVKWKVFPRLNHERKLLVLAEYSRKNGLS